jgi:tRNA(Ile)-lysidine synthase TilS/MesJ
VLTNPNKRGILSTSKTTEEIQENLKKFIPFIYYLYKEMNRMNGLKGELIPDEMNTNNNQYERDRNRVSCKKGQIQDQSD